MVERADVGSAVGTGVASAGAWAVSVKATARGRKRPLLNEATLAALRSNTAKTRVSYEATKKLRILTYNLSGDRVASAGVGTKDEPYTFPRHMDVATLLGIGNWIKILPTPGADGKDYESLPDFKPKTVVFVNMPDFVPTKWSQLGCQGCDRLTLLDTRCEEHYEEVPCADVSGVSTPPTPPSFWHRLD